MGGCCSCINSVQHYDIVLKAPDGKIYYHYENNKFVKYDDINKWIKKIYSCKFDNYVVYNDEHEGKSNGTCGHCKGILAWNNTKITWLVHSVPNFPEKFDGKTISDIPDNGLTFGQSFVFVDNIDLLKLETILINLYAMHPSIYISSLEVPVRFGIYEKKNQLLKPVDLKTNIMHISKTGKHNLDIYEHLSVLYDGKWKCRTWIRGNGCINTTKVEDVEHVMLEEIEYKYTRDHSKYACNHEYVIIGDLNRMTTQFDRGGGGIIIRDKKLAYEIGKLFISKT